MALNNEIFWRKKSIAIFSDCANPNDVCHGQSFLQVCNHSKNGTRFEQIAVLLF